MILVVTSIITIGMVRVLLLHGAQGTGRRAALRGAEGTGRRATSQPPTRGASPASHSPYLYGNLSCPFEMSKYSCQHMGEGFMPQAVASRELVSEHIASIATTAARLLPPGARVYMVGDSLMRQLWIALACMLTTASHAGGCTATPVLHWNSKTNGWLCHGTSNCVPRGNHSGFDGDEASLYLDIADGKPLAELHFRPDSVATAAGRELTDAEFLPIGTRPTWADHFLRQLEARPDGPLKLTPRPPWRQLDGHHGTEKELTLGAGDVVVMMRGVHHFSGIEQLADKGLASIAAFGDALLARPRSHRPKLVYVTSPSQHFANPSGRQNGEFRGLSKAACLSAILNNPRRDAELAALTRPDGSIRADKIIVYESLKRGGLKVAGDGSSDPNITADCTHFCMPGLPDLVAAELLRVLQSVAKHNQT